MAKPEHYATWRVRTKAAIAHQKRKRRLALGKAYIFKPGPLISARRYEYEPCEYVVRACHRVIKPTGTFERPLRQGGEQRESNPYKQIAGAEPNCCNEWPGLRLGLAPDAGVHEYHRRRRRRHHADHHHGPHGEYKCELHRAPWRVLRHHEPHAGRNHP